MKSFLNLNHIGNNNLKQFIERKKKKALFHIYAHKVTKNIAIYLSDVKKRSSRKGFAKDDKPELIFSIVRVL